MMQTARILESYLTSKSSLKEKVWKCGRVAIVDKVIVRTPVSFSFILINGMEFAIDGREYSDGRKFKTREY